MNWSRYWRGLYIRVCECVCVYVCVCVCVCGVCVDVFAVFVCV